MEVMEIIGVNLFLLIWLLLGIAAGAICTKAIYDEELKNIKDELKQARYDARFNMDVKVGSK